MYSRIENLPQLFAKALAPYATALLAVLIALVIRAVIHPLISNQGGEQSTFMAYTTFMVATAFSAWFLGWGPALLAIVSGLFVGDFLFTPPAFTLSLFSRAELPETATYLIACCVFLLIGIAKQRRTGLLIEKNREIEEANVRLRDMSAHLLRAQDDERRKIARDLHDSVGQYLGAVNMVLSAVLQTVKDWPSAVTSSIQQAIEMNRTCAKEVRTISHLLHPPLLDEMGLSAAARWYVEGFAARSGVQVRLNIPDDLQRFGSGIEIAIFRVLQESLTNVHRHSGSKTAQVTIASNDDRVWLEVRDQGRGLPQKAGRTVVGTGVGTSGMQQRIKELSGVLDFTSDESGTLVRALIPLRPEPASGSDLRL